MIGAVLLFAFVALGSKVLLGLAIVYVFIPESRECSHCDRDTTIVEAPWGLRTIAARIRVQRRWCPACNESFVARGQRPARVWVGPVDARPSTTPAGTPDHALLRRPQ